MRNTELLVGRPNFASLQFKKHHSPAEAITLVLCLGVKGGIPCPCQAHFTSSTTASQLDLILLLRFIMPFDQPLDLALGFGGGRPSRPLGQAPRPMLESAVARAHKKPGAGVTPFFSVDHTPVPFGN
jgi:hypothetical protein